MNQVADANEQHVRILVANFAATLRIAPPRVRFVKSSCGSCYEALFNCVEIDSDTLGLPEAPLRLVVAHEVAHATQRRALLQDFSVTSLVLALLIAVPCMMFVALPDEEFSRVTLPGLGFIFALILLAKACRPVMAKRAAELDLDADAKAAELCGTALACQAMQALAQSSRIDPARLAAMRQRSASLK